MRIAKQRDTIPMRIRRWVIALPVLGAMLMPMSSANAHYVYQQPELYRTSADLCVDGYAEISHGGGGGYTKVKVQARFGQDGVPCANINWDRPAGYLAVKTQLWKWGNGNWSLCRDDPWNMNNGNGSGHEEIKNYGTRTPCGDGWYGVTGYA